jgi:hypothetical protein
MRRKFFAASGGLALVLGLAFLVVPASQGQFAQRVNPGSNLIELTPAISTSQAVSGVAPLPVGKSVKAFQRLMGVTKVTSNPTGGSGAVLDVYYQYSADDGMTWQDFAHIQVNQTTGTYLVPVSAITAGPTTVPASQDGGLAANAIVQGPLGDKLRIKYSASYGSSTGNWTFQSFVSPD